MCAWEQSLQRSLLIRENRLERIEIVPRGECLEALAGLAMAQVAAQHFLEQGCEFIVRDGVEDLPPDRLVFAEATAQENMVAIEGFAGALRLRPKQPDVAHVVL